MADGKSTCEDDDKSMHMPTALNGLSLSLLLFCRFQRMPRKSVATRLIGIYLNANEINKFLCLHRGGSIQFQIETELFIVHCVSEFCLGSGERATYSIHFPSFGHLINGIHLSIDFRIFCISALLLSCSLSFFPFFSSGFAYHHKCSSFYLNFLICAHVSNAGRQWNHFELFICEIYVFHLLPLEWITGFRLMHVKIFI